MGHFKEGTRQWIRDGDEGLAWSQRERKKNHRYNAVMKTIREKPFRIWTAQQFLKAVNENMTAPRYYFSNVKELMKTIPIYMTKSKMRRYRDRHRGIRKFVFVDTGVINWKNKDGYRI